MHVFLKTRQMCNLEKWYRWTNFLGRNREAGGLTDTGGEGEGGTSQESSIDICTTLCKMGFPGGSDSKESAYNEGDPGSIPGSGRPLKGMATHSSILAWEIPWTEEPGRLPSIGSQRAGHGWVTHAFTCICEIVGSCCRAGSSAQRSLMIWRSGWERWEGRPRGKGHANIQPMTFLYSRSQHCKATLPRLKKNKNRNCTF